MATGIDVRSFELLSQQTLPSSDQSSGDSRVWIQDPQGSHKYDAVLEFHAFPDGRTLLRLGNVVTVLATADYTTLLALPSSSATYQINSDGQRMVLRSNDPLQEKDMLFPSSHEWVCQPSQVNSTNGNLYLGSDWSQTPLQELNPGIGHDRLRKFIEIISIKKNIRGAPNIPRWTLSYVSAQECLQSDWMGGATNSGFGNISQEQFGRLSNLGGWNASSVNPVRPIFVFTDIANPSPNNGSTSQQNRSTWLAPSATIARPIKVPIGEGEIGETVMKLQRRWYQGNAGMTYLP